MNKLTFEDMKDWDTLRLATERGRLRHSVSFEINKLNAIKAEILWLQTELEKYTDE